MIHEPVNQLFFSVLLIRSWIIIGKQLNKQVKQQLECPPAINLIGYAMQTC